MIQIALQHTKTSGSKIFHNLVSLRLVTQYPHGGIVENGWLRHANAAHGLHEIPFDPEGWDVIDVPDLVPGGIHLFDQHRGTPYDMVSLLAFLLPWRARDSKRMYCYEWMWLRLTGENPGFKVTPEKILMLAHRLRSA